MKCYLLLAAVFTLPLCAQRHEVGLTLGRLLSREVVAAPARIELGSGTALQANYGVRLMGGGAASLFGEVHFLANPQRAVMSTLPAATRDVATLYVTPGVRIKFAPAARVSPYLAIGGGYALYEQSTMTLGGQSNGAPRHLNRGAIQFGGGADATLLPWLAVRFEVRDFYTGRPAFNIAAPGGGLHNIVIGGGLVLRL